MNVFIYVLPTVLTKVIDISKLFLWAIDTVYGIFNIFQVICSMAFLMHAVCMEMKGLCSSSVKQKIVMSRNLDHLYRNIHNLSIYHSIYLSIYLLFTLCACYS